MALAVFLKMLKNEVNRGNTSILSKYVNSEDTIIAFLRGLLDADGCYSHHTVSLSNSNLSTSHLRIKIIEETQHSKRDT